MSTNPVKKPRQEARPYQGVARDFRPAVPMTVQELAQRSRERMENEARSKAFDGRMAVKPTQAEAAELKRGDELRRRAMSGVDWDDGAVAPSMHHKTGNSQAKA